MSILNLTTRTRRRATILQAFMNSKTKEETEIERLTKLSEKLASENYELTQERKQFERQYEYLKQKLLEIEVLMKEASELRTREVLLRAEKAQLEEENVLLRQKLPQNDDVKKTSQFESGTQRTHLSQLTHLEIDKIVGMIGKFYNYDKIGIYISTYYKDVCITEEQVRAKIPGSLSRNQVVKEMIKMMAEQGVTIKNFCYTLRDLNIYYLDILNMLNVTL